MHLPIVASTLTAVLLLTPAALADPSPGSAPRAPQGGGAARSIEVETQVIHGRAQKPYLVFHVVKRPFRFDVGTARYSWRRVPGSHRTGY